MPDPLRQLLTRLDRGVVVLTADQRRDLEDDWEAMVAAGVVVETTPAAVVECPGCDESHFAAVRQVATDGFPSRWFCHCPTVGAVRVDPDELRRWVVSVAALGRVLTGRDAEERIPDVVWRLGPIRVGGRDRLGWLVTGWRGRADLADLVPELRAANALVFVPARLPPAAVWGDPAPSPVIPLTEVLTTTGTGLVVNRTALAGYLPSNATKADADSRSRLSLPDGTPWEDVTLVVADHHVELVLGTDRYRAGYAELGLANGHSGAPNAVWHTLARLAAEGELKPADRIRTKPATLKTNVSQLRAALRRWTGLSDDPIPTPPRLQAYRPRFRLQPAATLKSPSEG